MHNNHNTSVMHYFPLVCGTYWLHKARRGSAQCVACRYCIAFQGFELTACMEQVHIGMHVSGAGAGIMSNVWIWGADHSQWSGQSMSQDAADIGFLGESEGPLWGVGVAAEHHRQAAFALRDAHNYQVSPAGTENPIPETKSSQFCL
jgi:hypothetical protein